MKKLNISLSDFFAAIVVIALVGGVLGTIGYVGNSLFSDAVTSYKTPRCENATFHFWIFGLNDEIIYRSELTGTVVPTESDNGFSTLHLGDFEGSETFITETNRVIDELNHLHTYFIPQIEGVTYKKTYPELAFARHLSAETTLYSAHNEYFCSYITDDTGDGSVFAKSLIKTRYNDSLEVNDYKFEVRNADGRIYVSLLSPASSLVSYSLPQSQYVQLVERAIAGNRYEPSFQTMSVETVESFNQAMLDSYLTANTAVEVNFHINNIDDEARNSFGKWVDQASLIESLIQQRPLIRTIRVDFTEGTILMFETTVNSNTHFWANFGRGFRHGSAGGYSTVNVTQEGFGIPGTVMHGMVNSYPAQ